MLDGYIIEELRRREAERQRQERQRPTVEIPVHRDDDQGRNGRAEQDEPAGNSEGGSVVTIDF